jgi:hypothetical protein
VSHSLTMDLCRRYAEAVKQTAEAWEAEEKGQVTPSELEKEVQMATPVILELADRVLVMEERAWAWVKAGGEPQKWAETGEHLAGLFAATVGALQTYLALIRRCEEHLGRQLQEADEVAAAIRKLERAGEAHTNNWPWFRKEDEDEALAEYARGETVPLEEAFAQIAGVSKEEWRRRVERRRAELEKGGAAQ